MRSYSYEGKSRGKGCVVLSVKKMKQHQQEQQVLQNMQGLYSGGQREQISVAAWVKERTEEHLSSHRMSAVTQILVKLRLFIGKVEAAGSTLHKWHGPQHNTKPWPGTPHVQWREILQSTRYCSIRCDSSVDWSMKDYKPIYCVYGKPLNHLQQSWFQVWWRSSAPDSLISLVRSSLSRTFHVRLCLRH